MVFAAATAHAGSCEALEHVNYSAAFNLPAENAKASSEPLRLVVGTAKTAEDVPQMVAQILDGKNCQAVCHIKAFARNENTLAPRIDGDGVPSHAVSRVFFTTIPYPGHLNVGYFARRGSRN